MNMRFAKLANPDDFFRDAMSQVKKFRFAYDGSIPDLWSPPGIHMVTCKRDADRWSVAATPDRLVYNYNSSVGSIIIDITIFDSHNNKKIIHYDEFFSENLNGAINEELKKHVELMKEFYETIKEGDDIEV